MYNKWFRQILCVLLAFIMVFELLPHQALSTMMDGLAEETEIQQPAQKEALDPSALDVVDEVADKRSEFSKEFIMSNGLHMSAVYSTAVHFEQDGRWEEIDNTLRPVVSTTGNFYTNTAGIWSIRLPQQLSSQNAISITKDGYTLSFALSGSLSNTGSGTEVMALGENETLQLSPISLSQGIIQDTGAAQAQAEADHPETVVTKNASRLQYSNVYPGTHVVYDLQSNELKESIIMVQHDATLRGYRYTLNVGSMIPVLQEDKSILFYDASRENVIMVMPAPFLLDAEYNVCDDVRVTLTGSGSTYTLNYLLPTTWLAAQDRAWPVVLDPVIQPNMNVENIRDMTVGSNYSGNNNNYPLWVGYKSDNGIVRTYLKYDNLPSLSSADVIVHATIQVYKNDGTAAVAPVSVHKVLGTWASETLTWSNKPGFNASVEDFALCDSNKWYTWTITDIVRDWYSGDNTGMMFKCPDSVENGGVPNYKQFFSSDYTEDRRPTLKIYFRNNNGLESYWDYLSASAGRAGTGYVNQYTGNLVWVHNDIGFGGNKMPVSISHVYNANDMENNTFGMGKGWRTNFNQRVYAWDEDNAYYVWEDADGTDHYFLQTGAGATTYKDEEGLELTLSTAPSNGFAYSITDKYGNASYFDTYGRMIKQENNQATKSSITITYTTSNGYLIDLITDGAGRKYDFSYTNGLLNKISFQGTGSTEITYATFGYSSSKLITITDKDNKSVTYGYSGNLLTSATDVDGYKLSYTYTSPVASWQPYRVRTVSETDDGVAGGSVSVQYDLNQTTFTDQNGRKQVVQFNSWGNTISIQDGQGRAQFAQFATDEDQTAGKGNQLSMASKLQNTVSNLFTDSSFENGTAWAPYSSSCTASISTQAAYIGNKSLRLDNTSAGGVETSFVAEAGKTYTFSAWVKAAGSNAYLCLYDGVTSAYSETLAYGSDWTRLQVSYTNSTNANKTIYPSCITTGAGYIYLDCVQLEEAPTASRYNLLENGDFRSGSGWSGDLTRSTGTPTAAPQLNKQVYRAVGTYNTQLRIRQTVPVSGSKGDTFVLAGWAWSDPTPDNPDFTYGRSFGLVAKFHNASGSSEEIYVPFNADVHSWQYAAAPILAPMDYTSVTVYVVYDYNANVAWFDGIQLYREQFGSSYTYDANGNVLSVRDLQQQTTRYAYENNDLTQVIQPTGATMTYEYDNYHNVTKATSATGLVYAFTYDTYGNNTQVSITSGSYTMRTSATYNNNGNTLYCVTDTAGNRTWYVRNAETNVLEYTWYPRDDDSSKTTFTYDEMYRLVESQVNVGGEILSADYSYTDDLLTQVETASTTYHLGYGKFGLRSQIQVGSQTLASYSYTEGDFQLKTLDYGNGNGVEYTYDDQGRLTCETYENGDTVSYQYDNSGALATVTDSATGQKTTYYYDFTDRLVKYVESGGDNHNHTVAYEYDTLNNLTKQVQTIRGTKTTVSYAYDKDNRVSGVVTDAASRYYTYDSYGRLSQYKTYFNGGEVLRTNLTYRSPSTSTTTNYLALLKHTTAAGTEISYSYTYDANGNILAVTSGGYTANYHYDTANQLLRENNQAAGRTWVWDYDNAGNILSRKEYAYTTGSLGAVLDTVYYTYGDSNWGDLLTSYDGQALTYDNIGNLTSDSLWTYTWEHGRQLAQMSKSGTTWSFEYDANGMRTKRTNGSTTYEYFYTGDKLTYMTAGDKDFWFYYDANGTPYALFYNGAYYYYITNAQGDVTAITDRNGNVVVQYTYDAWGNVLSTTGSYASTLGQQNPIRYRGYVYDQETGLYYLQSRYYNPEVGRFISSDIYACTGQGLLGNNMFAYCNNNPISWQDAAGTALETAWDVISFLGSLAEVVLNPMDPWAWLGLFGDALDVAIPCVGGLGEAVDALRTAIHSVEAVHGAYGLSQAFEQGISQIAETATTGSSNAKGQYGEMLAGANSSGKKGFSIDGRNRLPDIMTDTELMEVKNVSRICNTLQLQDYASHAQKTGRSLALIVRRSTYVTQSIFDAGWSIRYLW